MKIVFKDFIFLNDIEIKDILELRNKRYIRENMKAKQIISFEKHINFVNSLKNIANKIQNSPQTTNEKNKYSIYRLDYCSYTVFRDTLQSAKSRK